MLRIGRKDNDVQTKLKLDEEYKDITSVMMWIGICEKYGFDMEEAKKQIALYVASHEELNDHDKCGLKILQKVQAEEDKKEQADYDFV